MKRLLMAKMTMVVGFLVSQLRAAEMTTEGERGAGNIAGRLMLGAQTQLAHAVFSSSAEDNGTSSTERSANTLGLSLGATPLGVVFGYGLHHDWLLNASLSARRFSVDTGVGSNSEADLAGEAALSYFWGHGALRPYLGIQASVLGASSNQIERFGAGGGAHAGLRVELAEALSLEPRLAAGYTQTSSHYDVGSLQADIDEQSVGGSVALRLAGWL